MIMKRASFPGLMAGVVASCLAASAQVIPPHITWTEDPATTVTITWQRDLPGRGTVWYGTTTNMEQSASDPGGSRRHSIVLRDLQPQTRYYYKAVSTDGFASPPGRFLTAPSVSPTSSMRFALHGDLQGGLDIDGARSVVDAIIADDPDLVIHIGDMGVEDYEPGFDSWNTFFDLASNELRNVVFMPTSGNHDMTTNGNAHFWRVFNLPWHNGDRAYYSYDVGNIHFVVLNTEVGIESQTNWLARDLQAARNNTNITWIVPYLHNPPYSWGERSGSLRVRTNFSPVFVRYEADLVFSGHSHNYQRTIPIRGVRYVVSGGGGGRLYTTAFQAGTHASATTCYHYVSVAVTGNVMNYRAIRADGLVFDQTAFTNNGRFVRVQPAFPRRGETAKISYRAEDGPLAAANPVFIHLGLDAFTSPLISSAMTFNATSGRWDIDVAVPSFATNRLAFVFRNANSSIWHNNDSLDWQALLDRVALAPPAPVSGAPVTIRYEADMGVLRGSTQVWAVLDINHGRNDINPDVLMTNIGGQRWETTVPLPDYTRNLEVYFRGATNRDDNYGKTWKVPVSGATAEPPWPPLPLMVPGSPVVTEKPESGQNNPGDTFDFSMAGSPLRANGVDAGFGDFGELFFNADETNMYVGGIGTQLGGSNNVLVLFLGINSLTDDAWNLWHKSGPPKALDFMHNIGFTEPMDIAIVYGNEYGDRPDYTNFLSGSYDFGQGVYYLSSGSPDFFPMQSARLSQFDGEGTNACLTSDDDGNDRTTRWEASLPWSSLGATGVHDLDYLHVAGVIASSSTDGTNRYLSAVHVGERAFGDRDALGRFARNFVTLRPAHLHLGHGDYRNDGITNGWRQRYFGSIQGPPADTDSDGDDQDNREEYIAATHPADPLSFFAVSVEVAAGGPASLVWPYADGRTYSIYATPALGMFGEFITSLTTNRYQLSPLVEDTGFYAVGVRRE